MKIILSPVRMDTDITYEKMGDCIIINGEIFDFSPIGEGDTLPSSAVSSAWVVGDVERLDGQLTLTLILPLPANYSQEQAFPEPLTNVQDGPLLPHLPKPLDELPKAKESFDEQY